MPLSTLRLLLVLPILVSATSCLAVSAAVIIRNRPMLVRSNLFLALFILAIVPLVLAMLSIIFSASPSARCITAGVVVLPLVIGYPSLRRFVQGYTVLGVAEESLRAALKSALEELGLPFEESILGFELASLGAMLEVRFAPSLATATLRIRPPEAAPRLPDIAGRVRDHLEKSRHSASLNGALAYGATGLLFLILAYYQWRRF